MKIIYSSDYLKGLVFIECEDGLSIDVDVVVCIVLFGVLKKGSVSFEF